MGSFKALLVAGVASLAAMSTASAADLLLPPAPPVSPAYVPVDFGGGFYLRGDVGAGAVELRGASSSFNPNDAYPGGKPPAFAYNGAALTEQAIVGLGVGYQINHYFRADVTADYHFGSSYSALETALGCNGPAGVCADQYKGNITEAVFLINGYLDLGTWYCVTPYIGAGVGTSINIFSGVTDYNLSNFGQNAGSSSSNTHASFAYALMAGFSYSLTNNLKIDVGYRYLDMGRAETGTINCYPGICDNNSRERQHYHLDSQEVRLGLRYVFNDDVPPARYPLVRKY